MEISSIVKIVATFVRRDCFAIMRVSATSEAKLGTLTAKSGVWTFIPSSGWDHLSAVLRTAKLDRKVPRKAAVSILRVAYYSSVRAAEAAEKAAAPKALPVPQAPAPEAREAKPAKGRKAKAAKPQPKAAKPQPKAEELKLTYLAVRDGFQAAGYEPKAAYMQAVAAQARVKAGEDREAVVAEFLAMLKPKAPTPQARKPKASKTVKVTAVKAKAEPKAPQVPAKAPQVPAPEARPAVIRSLTAKEILARHNAEVQAKIDAQRAARLSR